MKILYPAIDLRGGRVVRLRRGDFAEEIIYGDDPVAVATAFVEQGATWIHIVDLDAALGGEPTNRPAVAAVAAAVAGRAKVQTGGGVRSVDDAEALVDAGVARVVMGSAAVLRPEIVDEVAAVVPVAVGLDHRRGELAVHGWTESSGVALVDAIRRCPSASAFVVTDIERDGLLAGPDIDGVGALVSITDVPIIASGGVSSLDDLVALDGIDGLHGIITGRALYEGRFTVADAIEALR